MGNQSENKITDLYDLEIDEIAKIIDISNECKGDTRRRLLDLGFVKGTSIIVQNKSPLGDPISYTLRGTQIALRKEQAKYILIEKGASDD